MKRASLFFAVVAVLAFNIIQAQNIETVDAIENPDTSSSYICNGWLCGGEMSNVWVYTGIPFGITRSTCCTYSDPENACRLANQAHLSCNSWRINDDFVISF